MKKTKIVTSKGETAEDESEQGGGEVRVASGPFPLG